MTLAKASGAAELGFTNFQMMSVFNTNVFITSVLFLILMAYQTAWVISFVYHRFGIKEKTQNFYQLYFIEELIVCRILYSVASKYQIN